MNYSNAIQFNSLKKTANNKIWIGFGSETGSLELDSRLLSSRSLRLREKLISLKQKVDFVIRKANIIPMFLLVLKAPVE